MVLYTQRDIAGVQLYDRRSGCGLCGVDGRASGVYLKRDLRTSVTFSQIPVSYGWTENREKGVYPIFLR